MATNKFESFVWRSLQELVNTTTITNVTANLTTSYELFDDEMNNTNITVDIADDAYHHDSTNDTSTTTHYTDDSHGTSDAYHGDGGHGSTDSHGSGHDDGEHHSEFGVHITYDDLYHSIVFLAAIYCAGVISSKVLKMPNLVGEIVCGIILGPPLLNFVPNAEAWVLLGEIG